MEPSNQPPKIWRNDPRIAWPMKRLGHAQLGVNEGAMLYYVARDWCSGQNAIVELGSFLGASTSLLGKGLKDNPNWDGQPRLHCYDLWEAKFGNMAEFIRKKIDPDFQDGSDFLHLFNAQTEAVSETIRTHKGDFERATWDDGQIEVLFVDISKTAILNRVILDRFFPALQVGSGLMINQDFHNPADPWIQTSIGYLLDYFELVEPRADDSVMFRLRTAIPKNELREAGRYEDLEAAEAVRRVDRIIELYNAEGHDPRYIELVKARLLIQSGNAEAGNRIVYEARARLGEPDPKVDFFWDRRCDMVLAMSNA